MSNSSSGKMWGMMTLLILILPVILMMSTGSAEESGVALRVTVIDEVKDPIVGASVHAINVHSGTSYDLYLDEGRGYYVALVPPGTYEVFASMSGFMTGSRMVNKLNEERSSSVYPIILTMMDNAARLHIMVMDNMMPVEGASVHIFASEGFHKMAMSDEIGWANFTCPQAEIHVLVFHPGMLTYSVHVEINSSLEAIHHAELDHQPSGKRGSYRALGFVREEDKFIPDVTVKIWDSINGHIVPFDRIMDGSVSVPLYNSSFRMLVEAKGYEPFWAPSIDLSTVPFFWAPENEVFDMTPIAHPEEKVTTIDMTGEDGVKNPTLTTDWTLDANSRIFGFENTFGTPRMQVSGKFYSSDWLNVDSSEAEAVNDVMLAYGPAWENTKDFILVNGKHYTASGNYSVETEDFQGSVFDAANPTVTSHQGYESEVAFNDGDNLRVEVLALLPGEHVLIKVPENYEILGDFGENAEFPYMEMTNMILVKNPLELNAKKEKAPTAVISFSNAFDFYRAEDKTYVVSLDKNVTLSGKGSTDPVGKVENYEWTIPLPIADYEVIKGNLSGTSEDEADEITLRFKKNSNVYHNVTLKVTDSSGLVSEADWIHIKPDGVPPVITEFTVKRVDANTTMEAPYEVEEDVELEFNASSATDNSVITNYVWTFGDDNAPVNGKTVVYRFSDPGTFNISLKLIDAVQNEELLENVTSITVKDTTKPMAVIKPLTEDPLMGNEFTLNGSQSYDPRTSGNIEELANYTWWWVDKETGDNVTVYGKVMKYTFLIPGDYMINLTVTDENGLKGWVTKPIRVQGPDLEVRNIEFRDPDINSLREKKKTKISIPIINNGNVDAPANWTLQVLVDGKVVREKLIDVSIASKETYFFNFTYTLPKAGNREFQVIVDVNDDVKEEVEEPNDFKTTVKILEADPILQWWWFLIALAVLVVVYVVFMKVTRNEWGYEVIVDWWNKRKKD